MVWIYLNATSSYNPYGANPPSIQTMAYSPCKLFKKYRQTPKKPINVGDIQVYKEYCRVGCNYATLKAGSYRNDSLKNEDIYFNVHDKKSTPLILVLNFKTGQSRYYKRSEFEKEIKRHNSKNIEHLNLYEDEEKLLPDLLKENDQIIQTLTYDIGKTTKNTTNSLYNNEKIKVEDDTVSVPKLPSTAFQRYTHTPQHTGSDRNVCVIYNQNVLFNKGGNEIEEIQGKEFKDVKVYFGTKAKKKDGSDFLPLMVEFAKKTNPLDPDYYVHKRKSGTGNSPEYYWEALPGSNGKVLCELLTDMGFGTSQGAPGYEQLKSILDKSGIRDGGDDLGERLKQLMGNQLKTLLKQNVTETGSQNPTLLVLLLKKIEFELVDSFIILLDKNTPITYNERAVNEVVSNLDPKRDINLIKMSSNNIDVTDQTDKKGLCVKNYNYKLICHDISKLTPGITGPNKSDVGISFVMPTINNKYNLITLYKSDKIAPENIEYTYYTSNQNEIYVYFYSDDPRPLLLCYKGSAYKPMKVGDPNQTNSVRVDYIHWVKANGITEFTCQNLDIEGPNGQLLSALTEVVRFMNPVELNITKLPDNTSSQILKPPNTTTYVLHQYTNTATIKVKISSTSLYCYNIYSYEHDTSSSNTNFRLGSVLYTPRTGKPDYLNYTTSDTHKYDPLLKVNCYYFKNDDQIANPLIVGLEFRDGNKEYHKLVSNNPNHTWTVLKSNKVEGDKLYDILYTLNTNFNRRENLKEEDCKPKSDNTGAIAGISVGSMAGAGALGGGGYFVYSKIIVTATSVVTS